MNKTYRNEYVKLFLLEHLPAPLTRADRHLQIFDNYIEKTRLRLRSIRVPETKQWTWILQQRFVVDDSNDNMEHWKIAEIHLNEIEYHAFAQFEDREIRKNRYFYKMNGKQIEIDVFLGELWGVNLARVCFKTPKELCDFQLPFSFLEVTGEKFFQGENLVEKKFADVRAKVAEIIENKISKNKISG